MKTAVFGLVALTVATPALANDFEPAMRAFLEAEVQAWVNDGVIVNAINAQNAQTMGLSNDEIIAMDNNWRAEVGSGSTPTITPVLSNAAAEFLRQQVEASGGVITEVFAMDAQGLNVAASDVTSDYWQGDEDKHAMTYPQGPGAMHFSEIEFDESSQMYQGQISTVVVDPATGQAIGAITVGVNAEALM